jgi:hypothetical protein
MKPVKTIKKIVNQVKGSVESGINSAMDTSVGRTVRDGGNKIKQKVEAGFNAGKNSAFGQTIQAAGTGIKETAKSVAQKVKPKVVKTGLAVMKGVRYVKDNVEKAASTVKGKVVGRKNERAQVLGEDAELQEYLLNNNEANYHDEDPNETDPFNVNGPIYRPITTTKNNKK